MIGLAPTRKDDMINGDLMHGLATTDHVHSDPGLELGTMGATLAQGWQPPSGAEPTSKANNVAVWKNQSTAAP